MASSSDRGVGLRYLFREPDHVRTVHGSLNSLDPSAARDLSRRLLGSSPRKPPPRGRPLERIDSPVYREPFEVPVEEKTSLLGLIGRKRGG